MSSERNGSRRRSASRFEVSLSHLLDYRSAAPIVAPSSAYRPVGGAGYPSQSNRPAVTSAAPPGQQTASAALATSHHRAEDAQPNDATTLLHRRPAAPPQLVSASQVASTSNLEAQSTTRGAPAGAGAAGGRVGARYKSGRGGNLLIQRPRDGGQQRTAGGWSDGPSQRYHAQDGNGKGKEREQVYYPTAPGGSFAPAPWGRGPPLGAGLPLRPAFSSNPYPSSSASFPASTSSYANTSARSAYGYPSRNSRNIPSAPAPTVIAVPANPLPKVPRLYVSGLPVGVGEKEVRDVFRKYGSIYELTVTTPLALPRPSTSSFPAHIAGAPDPSTPIPTHTFAHVTFDKFPAAQAALAALDRAVFPATAEGGDGGKRMSVEWSDPDKKKGATLVERRAPDEIAAPSLPPSEPRGMREQRERDREAAAAREKLEAEEQEERERQELFNRATATPALSQAGTLKTDGDGWEDDRDEEGSDEEVGRRLLITTNSTSRNHSRTPSAVEVHHALYPSPSRPSSAAATPQPDLSHPKQRELIFSSSLDPHFVPGAKLKLPGANSKLAASGRNILTRNILELTAPSGRLLPTNKKATYVGEGQWLARWSIPGAMKRKSGKKGQHSAMATQGEGAQAELGLEEMAREQLERRGAQVKSVEREVKGAVLAVKFGWDHTGPRGRNPVEEAEEQAREARQDTLQLEQRMEDEDDPDAEIDQLRSDTEMDQLRSDSETELDQASRAPRPPPPAPQFASPAPLAPSAPEPVVASSPPRQPSPAPSPGASAARPPLHQPTTVHLDDGTLTLSIPLPLSCIGDTEEAVKARKAMRLAEVKRATAEGKVVLGSSWTENALVLSYEEDETMEEVAPAPVEEPPAPTPPPAPPVPAPVVESASARDEPGPDQQQQDVDMEDVKPGLEPSQEKPTATPPEPTPRPPSPPERAPVLFPFPINPPTAETEEIEGHVEAFIKEYFSRFDSSRAMLEYLYTPHAIFSVKVLSRIPPRLRHAPAPRPTPPYHAFPKRFTQAANKVSATPTAIVNAITHLPTGSHDLTKIVYDAREIPELQARKGKSAPILLHLQAEFDEFPQHVVRSVYRTFVLVPKNASTGGQGCPLKYLIQSDQLVYGHLDSRAPGELEVMEWTVPAPAREVTPRQPTPPRTAAQAMPPPVVVAQPQPPARTPPPAPAPAPALAPAPIAPRPLAHAARPAEKRPRSPPPPPAPAPASGDVDSDVIVLSDSEGDEAAPQDQQQQQGEPSTPVRPAKRLNRRSSIELELELTSPVPRPLPVQQPSSTSLGKRRAASPPPPRHRALQGASSSSMARRDSNQSASSRLATSSSDEDEDEGDGSGSSDDEGSRSAAVAAVPAPEPVGTFLTPAQIEELIDRRIAAKAREEERKERKDKSKTEARAKRRQEKEKERAREKEKSKPKKSAPLAPLDVGEAPGAIGRPEAPEPKDARIVIPGGTSSVLHGFNGSTNKMRYMVDTGDSLLGISLCGDLVEWDPSAVTGTPRAGVHRVHRSTTDAYRVDDFAYSQSKAMVVVPYLGVKQDKTMSAPKHQVVLFRRDKDQRTISKWTTLPLKQQPHLNCGITATTIVPGDKSSRLRFVTAGEDKSLYLWTRSRSKGEVTTDRIACSHTSMVTGLDYLEESGYVVSGAKDKRLFAYDLERQQAVWSAVVPAAINGVQAVPVDSNLFLAKVSTGHDQFHLFDLRVKSGNSSLTFGFRLQPKKSSTSSAPLPPALGRYLRGSFRGMQYAHPDSESGVKLWDLRNLKDDGSPRMQALLGAGRSRVVQTTWRSAGGEDTLALLELANFTSIKIR